VDSVKEDEMIGVLEESRRDESCGNWKFFYEDKGERSKERSWYLGSEEISEVLDFLGRVALWMPSRSLEFILVVSRRFRRNSEPSGLSGDREMDIFRCVLF